MSIQPLMNTLLERGSQGCDLSPGDQICLLAYKAIKELIKENDILKVRISDLERGK